jgi:hypothetical protein
MTVHSVFAVAKDSYVGSRACHTRRAAPDHARASGTQSFYTISGSGIAQHGGFARRRLRIYAELFPDGDYAIANVACALHTEAFSRRLIICSNHAWHFPLLSWLKSLLWRVG